MIDESVIKQIIKQEVQLLDRVEAADVLAELIDDAFIEIGSSSVSYNKAEVVRWLNSENKSERIGTTFKAHVLSESIIILTYLSSIKSNPTAVSKQAMRSSTWRLTNGQWRMVFHQGTPLQSSEK